MPIHIGTINAKNAKTGMGFGPGVGDRTDISVGTINAENVGKAVYFEGDNEAIDQLVRNVAPELHTLNADQLAAFNECIKALKGENAEEKQTAVKWLNALALSIPGTIISAVITKSIGG